MIERGGFGVVSWPGREWALGTSVERRVFVGRHLDRTACSDSGHHSPKCCRVPEEDIEEKLTAYRAELLAKVEAAKSAADLALQEERQVFKGGFPCPWSVFLPVVLPLAQCSVNLITHVQVQAGDAPSSCPEAGPDGAAARRLWPARRAPGGRSL